MFGILPKALQNPNSKFCTLATDIFDFGLFDSIKFVLMSIAPNISKKIGFALNNNLEAVDYFCNLLKNTFEYRKKNNIQRNDFIQLLMALKQKEKIELQSWDPLDDYLKDDDVPSDYESYGNIFLLIFFNAYKSSNNFLSKIQFVYIVVRIIQLPIICCMLFNTLLIIIITYQLYDSMI